jgi:hypothetical protein
MNGYIMLESTYRLLSQKKEYFESIIKKNKNSDRPEQIKQQKIQQAIEGAQKIAPCLRKYALIKNFRFSEEIVTFGCILRLNKGQEKQEITILGEADIKFNPKYRSKKGFIAYGSKESLEYVGKEIGAIINGWELTKIERF